MPSSAAIGPRLGRVQTRAHRRLALALGLLATSPARFAVRLGQVQRAAGPAEVLAVVNALPPACRAELRALVDWVEDYERAEAHSGACSAELRSLVEWVEAPDTLGPAPDGVLPQSMGANDGARRCA